MNAEIMFTGTCVVLSLIVAIGPQNSFVFSSGVRGRHVLSTTLATIVCDSLLSTVGIIGFGPFLAMVPICTKVLFYAGVAWLLICAVSSFKKVMYGGDPLATTKVATNSSQAVLTAMAFSFLNPHAYLDGVILLGSFSSSLPNHYRVSFYFGVIAGTVVWFTTLAFAGKLCAPILQSRLSWRIFHGVVGVSLLWALLALLKEGVARY